MLVAMYYNNKDVRVQEMPVPEINDDELLLKVMASRHYAERVHWMGIEAQGAKGPRARGDSIIDKVGKNVTSYS